MKTIYQKPATIVIKVETQQMIALSTTSPEEGFDTTSANELGEGITGGSLSRRGNLWDDEEE